MLTFRTDLATEAHRLWQESAGKTTRLPGVKAREERVEGLAVERVEILSGEGERALGKRRGTYLTVDISPLWRREPDSLRRTAEAAAVLLGPMLPEKGTVLVAGLGNRQLTADALGPAAVEHLLVTRHLTGTLPGLRPVAAMAGGVLGQTGMEAAEWIAGVCARVRPGAVVLVDALASARAERLCASLQLSDTGIAPGSGVGNHRMALSRETVGVPVISLGVPTVAAVREEGRLFLTAEDIDLKIAQLGRLLGRAISLAAQPGLDYGTLTALLE